jgi:hypothetical protein
MKIRGAFAPGLVALLAMAVVTAGCGSSETPRTTAGDTAGAAPVFSFPTGPAVLVPAGYAPPTGHVDSTGAHLPANGKPTLVLVDAIW